MPAARWVAVGLVAAAAACATNPATGRRQLMVISEPEEIQLGRQSHEQIAREMGVYEDGELARYVDRVGQRLARASHRPHLPWTFTVVDAPAVNAFALPGGFIYVTRGILPFLRDEAELAAVLGHEIGHVDARHGAAAYSRQVVTGGSLAVLGVLVPETQAVQGLAGLAFGLMFLKHGREAELEADRLGVGYSAASGWDPAAMPALLGTLARLDEASGSSRGVPNWALTHPPAEDRVERVQDAVRAARPGGTPATNRADFERRLDGLVFGDSREKGIVRGSEFLHPVLRIALAFPAGWDLANTDERVVAREREDAPTAMVLEIVPGADAPPEDTARAALSRGGYREVGGRREIINGLPAWVGIYDGTVSGTRVRMRAAFIRAEGRTYLAAGVAPPADFARVDPAFDRTIRSFRALGRQEADRIQPNRIDFAGVRTGDTWESLARGAAGGLVRAPTLAIMNGSTPATPPRPGERVRIVAGG